jgi:hypothetical protein
MDVMELVWELLFGAAVSTVFGEAFLERAGEGRLRAAFHAFESGFELAASPVPQGLQRAFCRARAGLLACLRHLLAMAPTPLPPASPHTWNMERCCYSHVSINWPYLPHPH